MRNNCVFSDVPKLVQNKIPKKVSFLGNFPGCIFHHVSFSWLCFYTVLFGWSTMSGWASEKTLFGYFFGVRIFFRQDGCHIFPPTGLNLESAEISTSKLANSKQQMSKSIQQFLKEMANASGNFGHTLVGLKAWNDAIHDFRRSARKNCIFSDRFFFSGI